MSDRILYGYWRSSAAYRVRIALNHKQLAYQQRSIHLINNGGEQHSAEFQKLNPNQLIPVLVDEGISINQSLTIMDYLDEAYPEKLLVPQDSPRRYSVKALAQDIAIDIHPLNNLRVQQYLAEKLGADDVKKSEWYQYWIDKGFFAVEKRLEQVSGEYSVGDEITLVDVCLVPQVYNAHRFNVDLSPYPNITRVTTSLNRIEAFKLALPEAQPDAE